MTGDYGKWAICTIFTFKLNLILLILSISWKLRSIPCNMLFATWDDKFGKIEGSCKQTTILNKFFLSFLFSHTKFSNLDKVIGCSVFDNVTKHAEAIISDIGK